MPKDSKKFPIPTRLLEFVFFVSIEDRRIGSPGFMYLAIDAYSKLIFNTGTEKDNKPETVLKHIYLLTEHRDFVKHLDKGFTLVLHKHEELATRIISIIKPLEGSLLIDEEFHTYMVLN